MKGAIFGFLGYLGGLMFGWIKFEYIEGMVLSAVAAIVGATVSFFWNKMLKKKFK